MQTSTELSVRDVRPTPSQASPSCPSGASMARYRKGPPIRSEAYWTTGVAPHAFSLGALVYTPAACVSCSSLGVLCARLYTGARVGPFLAGSTSMTFCVSTLRRSVIRRSMRVIFLTQSTLRSVIHRSLCRSFPRREY